MSTGPLGYGSVPLDANGRGVIHVGPKVYGYKWLVRRLITQCSAGTVTLNVYRQIESASALTDTTRRGAADTSETELTLNAGEDLVAVYSQGTPGAVATFNVQGEQVRA